MKREYDLRHARRGAVKPAPPGKTRMLIHVDNDILDWLRAQIHATGGGDYEETIKASRGCLCRGWRGSVPGGRAAGQFPGPCG